MNSALLFKANSCLEKKEPTPDDYENFPSSKIDLSRGDVDRI